MNDFADLHLHTYYSDGFLSPSEVIEKIALKRIKVASITDHDSIDGIEEAKLKANQYNIEIINGIELSAEIECKEIHLLGYFFNCENNNLKKHIENLRIHRLERAYKIIEKLNYLGINITLDQVLERTKHKSIGRPHIANTMVSLGIVKSYNEAFDKYLKESGPAYVKKNYISAIEAIKIINNAGGVVVLAHPINISNRILSNLINLGLDGIETVHPSINSVLSNNLKSIANNFFLVETGGSDFHGGPKNDDDNIGTYSIPIKLVDAIRRLVYK